MNGIAKDIPSNCQRDYETILINAFNAYGYSEGWIVANLDRVICKEVRPSENIIKSIIYSVDGRDLFKISIEMTCDFVSFVTRFRTFVDYIASIEKRDAIL